MPKIDPVTGCTVQTQAEFWNSEAQKEGKGRSGADLLHDFYDEEARALQQDEDRYREPKFLLDFLQRQVRQWNKDACEEEERVPPPWAVLEIEQVSLQQRFGGGSLVLRVRVQVGRWPYQGVLDFNEWHDHGTRLDPPDGETFLTWTPAA